MTLCSTIVPEVTASPSHSLFRHYDPIGHAPPQFPFSGGIFVYIQENHVFLR